MKREKKYRRSQQAALFAGAMALLAMSAGCGRKTGAGEVHIGYFNNITHAQALYMKAQGMLEDAFGTQARVQWTAFHAGPAEVEAMFAGDIDIGYIGPIPAITANVRSDGDIQILSGAAMAGAQLMRAADADIETVADLDGKTVAVPQIGNTQHLCLLQLLSDYGLQTVEEGGTVKVTAVENADVQNMMDQGGIDAALVPEPWGTLLAENGAQTVLDYDEVYAGGDYPVAVVAVRKDFLEEEPELVNT
ncbi:MAG: aliphatic sulfonate ABC transporter substrate-binding protein, partial [Lachnospiraceae bacterium]